MQCKYLRHLHYNRECHKVYDGYEHRDKPFPNIEKKKIGTYLVNFAINTIYRSR